MREAGRKPGEAGRKTRGEAGDDRKTITAADTQIQTQTAVSAVDTQIQTQKPAGRKTRGEAGDDRKAVSAADAPTRTQPDCEVSPHNRLYDGFPILDHHVEINFAILVLFAQLGFGGADGFGEAFVADVGLFGLLLGLLKARVQVAQARVVDGAASRCGRGLRS